LTFLDTLATASFKEIFIVMIFLFGFPVVTLGSYWRLFGNPFKPAEDDYTWRTKHHSVGDFWDGENLDDVIGTIGADGRPTGSYRQDASRDEWGGVERFHHGGR